jgi:hypothetical protein
LLLVATYGPAGLAGEPAATDAAPAGQGIDGEPERRADSVDLRPNLQRWSLDPRRQCQRGTCSVFVITTAMEYAVARRQGRTPRLSVEFLNWASNRVTKQPEDGGFFSDLWKGYRAFGVCPEKDLPYRDEFEPALQPSSQALEQARHMQAHRLQLHWIKEWDPHKGLSEEQFVAIKQTLRRQWPVCGGFLWPKQPRWENGVLQMCPREAVRDGHSVLLVGFRDEPTQPGGGVFPIRNTAGDGRDGLMSYEYVRTYMNDAIWIDGEGPKSLPRAEGG